MSFFKTVCFLTLSASLVSGLTTPFVAARRDTHHALAARVASSAQLDLPPVVIPLKRSLNKRCKPRSSASKTASSAATAVVGNIGSSPDTTVQATSTKVVQTKTEAETTKAAATTKAAVTTKAATTKVIATKTTKPASTPTIPSSNLPSYLIGTQTGEGTFYGTGLGACGITNYDTDHIAAVSHLLFDTFPGYKGGNPNNNPICNRQVRATYQGKSVVVSVTDRCEGCALTDLDFSPAAFNTLALPAVGRLQGVKWVWI